MKLRDLAPPMSGTGSVLQGTALGLPLPDDSVDLIITSPPYFALRSYRDEGEHYDGQVGGEPTPHDFVEALVRATEEMARVLKPSGSIFVNLGDKYAGTQGAWNGATKEHSLTPARDTGTFEAHKRVDDMARFAEEGYNAPRRSVPQGYEGFQPKSLMLLPHRYAIRCMDELGLTLRAEIIWLKRHALPESVQDRVRRQHEVWWHFTKRPTYYSALDEIREDVKVEALDLGNYAIESIDFLGRIPHSVWEIAPEPLKIPPEVIERHDLPIHFAAFPSEFVRRLILGWSPPGICTQCGEGRRPAMEYGEAYKLHRQKHGEQMVSQIPPQEPRILGYMCSCTPYDAGEVPFRDLYPTRGYTDAEMGLGGVVGKRPNEREGEKHQGSSARTKAWGTWHFDQWEPAPTKQAVVLDPFGGTGTTAMVARALGRTGVSVDLSMDYCRLADWRIHHSVHWANAVARTYGGRKPQAGKPLPASQGELF